MKNTYIIILLCLLCPLSLYSYNLRQITNENGLSNSAILSIHQDQEGFMWFGSCDGLNRYNGIDIQVYKPTINQTNLLGNLIERIVETEDNIFWIRTNYGLNKFDKRKGTVEHHSNFKDNYFLQKSKNNTLFILQGNNQIFYYHETSRTFKTIRIENVDFKNVLNFIITKNDKLWIFLNNGSSKSYSINNTHNDELFLSPDTTFDHPNKLLYCFGDDEAANQVYIIDNEYDLYEYNLIGKKKSYVCNVREEVIRKGEISSVIKYHNGYFVGFKTNGLLHFKRTKSKEYEMEEIDVRSGIFCLLKDRYQDLVWIGTDGQGVYMYSDDLYSFKSTVFSHFTHKIEKPVRSLYLDDDNTLWVGTKGDGIVKIYDYNIRKSVIQSKVEYLTTENSSLRSDAVYAFGKSERKILWIGSEEGLGYFSYAENKIKSIDLKEKGEDIKYIHSICELNDSILWLSTVGMGIVKVSIGWSNNAPILKTVKRIILNNGDIPHNYFFTIYKENDSTLWFGNRGYGAFKVEEGKEKLNPLTFGSKDKDKFNNQTLNDIFSIIKDRKNNYWFGTSFGLVKYDGKNETVFNEKDGFPNSTIHGILKDSQDDLWLSTNQGIIRFNSKRESFQIYNKQNGLQVIEYSDGAFFKDPKSGMMFFGGINGFTSIIETGSTSKTYLPPINFYNLSILGQKVNIHDYLTGIDGNDVLHLTFKQNFFSISFAALDYINGDNYSYQYKLDELSEQWIDNGSSHTISFTNISAGKYRLYVKYVNKITGTESSVYTILLRIQPPWYMSPWAYITYALLALVCLGAIGRSLDIKSRKKREQMLYKLEQEHKEEVHESKLDFFTSVAHEFCTPLTLISGPCSRILGHKESDRFIRQNTLLIQRNADKLNGLVQELIEFRRIETGNRVPHIESLHISDLSNDIVDSFNDLADTKSILLEKSIQDDLFWNSDRSFLYTIISNLVSNAFTYTQKGEAINVVIKEDACLSMEILISSKSMNNANIESFFDRNRILDRFENPESSTHNELGLAIAYEMINLLEGTIDLSRISDDLTAFSIKLPPRELSDGTNAMNVFPEIKTGHDAVIQELPNYVFDKKKQTVLIIDDDLETLWLICEVLVEDFNVIPINEPVKPELILKEFQPNVIICNAMMSGMDGIAFTKYVKSNKSTSHISTILISAKQTMEEQIEGLAAGADIYIIKPFNVDYLKVSVNHLISRKETLKNYFNSPLSAYDMIDGKLTHKENQKFIQSVLETINNNITNKELSPNFVASELGMSTRHLYRKMNEIEGQSISDLIKEGRLHIANNLLLNTKLTIDEIIYKSGFSNRATFFKVFAHKYNCTPKEYRENKTRNLDS